MGETNESEQESQGDAAVFVKATKANLCGFNGFQFEVGKTYEHHGDVQCCTSGFHCCDVLNDIATHSPYAVNGYTRYFIVKAWGRNDAFPQLTLNGDIVFKKYAFQCMQFVTELKYSTLAEVKQSMADIGNLFRGWKRDANLQQFDSLQAKFPSILKRASLLTTTKGRPRLPLIREALLPAELLKKCHQEDVNKCELECLTRYGNELGVVPFSSTTLCLFEDDKRKFDVYHCDHEPALGLCYNATKAYLQQLCLKQK